MATEFSYSMNPGDKMETTKEEKDLALGVALTKDLKFTNHIARAANNGNRVTGAIRRSFRYHGIYMQKGWECWICQVWDIDENVAICYIPTKSCMDWWILHQIVCYILCLRDPLEAIAWRYRNRDVEQHSASTCLRVLENWNNLAESVVTAPSLNAWKTGPALGRPALPVLTTT